MIDWNGGQRQTLPLSSCLCTQNSISNSHSSSSSICWEQRWWILKEWQSKILGVKNFTSSTKRLDKRVRKNPQLSVNWVTVRSPLAQLAPGGLRQRDKTRETLDPRSQKAQEAGGTWELTLQRGMEVLCFRNCLKNVVIPLHEERAGELGVQNKSLHPKINSAWWKGFTDGDSESEADFKECAAMWAQEMSKITLLCAQSTSVTCGVT